MMSYTFIRYYAIKDSIRFINSNMTYMQNLSNQVLFKYAMFWDIDQYYKIRSPFKKNPYQINTKITHHFECFLKEALHTAYMHASIEEQLFCYYLLISYVVEEHMTDYVQAFVEKRKRKAYIDHMLETYFFNKNEKIKLHKTNVADYFFDSFELNLSDINLLEKAIKRQFGFFCTKNYYLECYRSARFYFDHLARSTTGMKKPIYFIYDLFFNLRKSKKRARTYLYPKRLDTTVLNLTKKEFALHDQTVAYTMDELYQVILKESRRACDALNSYFTNNEAIKPLEKFFQKNKKEPSQEIPQ